MADRYDVMLGLKFSPLIASEGAEIAFGIHHASEAKGAKLVFRDWKMIPARIISPWMAEHAPECQSLADDLVSNGIELDIENEDEWAEDVSDQWATSILQYFST